MNLRDRILYQQIHPVKLGTDIGAAVVSTFLPWQRRPRTALLVHFLPPIIVSTALLRWANLEQQRQSAFGRYIARSMTRSMEAVRLTGDGIMVAGAWYRRPELLVLGLLVVLTGWVRGALRPEWARRHQ